MSFGKARTTAGARLCSPPITIGIFPAPTTSEAILVTPPTISAVRPKAGVSPRSATGTSQVPLVVHHEGLEVVRGLADRPRRESGAPAERAGAIVRNAEQS